MNAGRLQERESSGEKATIAQQVQRALQQAAECRDLACAIDRQLYGPRVQEAPNPHGEPDHLDSALHALLEIQEDLQSHLRRTLAGIGETS